MATLREYILSQSTLPTGNTVRDHIQNPITGGGGGEPYPVYYQDIQVEVATRDVQVNVLETSVETDQTDVSVAVEETSVETNIPIIKVEVDE